MLVEQTKNNILVIPILEVAGILKVDEVVLQPGINDIDDDQWKAARAHVLNKIKSRELIEEHAKVEEKKVNVTVGEDPKTKEPIREERTEVVIDAKSFSKLKTQEAINIVNRTVSLATLEKWKKKEHRDAVRTEIMNRIELVEKYGEEKKEKLKDKKEDE